MKVRRKRGGRARGRLGEQEYFCQAMVAALSEQELKLLEMARARLRGGGSEPSAEERELQEKLRQDWQATCEQAREAVRSNPGRADNHVSLGACLERLGRYEEAEASYREAIRLEPEDASLPRLLVLLDEQRAAAKRSRGGLLGGLLGRLGLW